MTDIDMLKKCIEEEENRGVRAIVLFLESLVREFRDQNSSVQGSLECIEKKLDILHLTIVGIDGTNGLKAKVKENTTDIVKLKRFQLIILTVWATVQTIIALILKFGFFK